MWDGYYFSDSMHRLWKRRAAALLLIVWTAASLGERAVFDHCPQHDPLAAAMAAMAGMPHSGATDAHQPGGHSGKHHCCCLEECGAVFTVPAASNVQVASAPPASAPVARRRDDPPARIDTRLPFANGPPHASAA
jgi:hypothetical protein